MSPRSLRNTYDGMLPVPGQDVPQPVDVGIYIGIRHRHFYGLCRYLPVEAVNNLFLPHCPPAR